MYILRGCRLKISYNILFLSLTIAFITANRTDSDEMPHSEAFHQGLHCLLKHWFIGIQYTKD